MVSSCVASLVMMYHGIPFSAVFPVACAAIVASRLSLLACSSNKDARLASPMSRHPFGQFAPSRVPCPPASSMLAARPSLMILSARDRYVSITFRSRLNGSTTSEDAGRGGVEDADVSDSACALSAEVSAARSTCTSNPCTTSANRNNSSCGRRDDKACMSTKAEFTDPKISESEEAEFFLLRIRRRLLIKYANGTNDKSEAPTDTEASTDTEACTGI
mmetsp:Transcript_14388/g.38142  ORF Transcript_14388/g.38142 Transcript_14388/m.38142 type:complete len:218 (+) Transcript_14388:916-1569(+)